MKYCVIIPTYNNDKTLQKVIDGVKIYTPNVIIVNDGSTDKTKTILDKISDVTVVHFPKNRGKGSALHAGFKQAKDLGFEWAITIDSDGQHDPNGIPSFVTAAETSKGEITIGARNMVGSHIPERSRRGNRYAGFWYSVETGHELGDTQSGYRVYPVELVNKLFCISKGFGFETEILARMAWAGYEAKEIPIEVYYPPPGERVSHYKVVRDSVKIFFLIVFLVICLTPFMRLRMKLRNLKKRKLPLLGSK